MASTITLQELYVLQLTAQTSSIHNRLDVLMLLRIEKDIDEVNFLNRAEAWISPKTWLI